MPVTIKTKDHYTALADIGGGKTAAGPVGRSGNMTNGQIYKKTLGFSLRRLIWDVLAVVLFLVLSFLGFVIGDRIRENGPIGLLIGAVIGLIAMVIILRFVAYLFKAGQIAMMTRAITEGELPEDVIAEGKRTVRERFVTVAVFYAIANAIKGIFNQIGKGLTKVGQTIGGDTGGAVGSTVSSILQTIVRYLSDCCLGWVFYRKEVKSAKAACEGAVLFFKHGKTFARNMGRVFGLGIASFLVIGGIFTAIFYPIAARFPEFYESLAASIAAEAEGEGWLYQLLQNPATLPIVFAAVGGIIVWAILHPVFVKPFVLTGVLRNYLQSGMNDIPTEDSFALLDTKSAKFRKLHSQI